MTMAEGAIVRRPHQSDPSGAKYVLLAPRSHVKQVKSALEKVTRFDKYHGIAPDPSDEHRMRVPTTIAALAADAEQTTLARLLTELNLAHLLQDITLSSWIPPTTSDRLDAEANPLRRALREALRSLAPDTLNLPAVTIDTQSLAPDTLNPPALSIDTLVSTFPESYSVYKPLLLLPSTTLDPSWRTLLSHHPAALEPLWSHLATAFACTHVALNSPIPASNTASPTHASDAQNILRSPANLTPLYGFFGEPPTPQTLSHPTVHDFHNALWAHTTQNGIRQTWAPLYTMFSRGNIKEKARILHLPSVREAVAAAGDEGASAVDLYAGIGYFAFSYARAGCRPVLCWELNEWSVEGLRRGAALNGWRARVLTTGDVPGGHAPQSEWAAWRDGVVSGGEDLLVFAMSNETADTLLAHLRSCLSPVRHVNLGLLPVSRLSWPSAVRAVDAARGGWVHAHENVPVADMDERRAEVEAEFQRLADDKTQPGRPSMTEVNVEHVERVKMYAPGVVHAVFDLSIAGTQTDG